jgi:hypothetical protein
LTGQKLTSIYQKKGNWFLEDGTEFKTGMEISVYPLLRELT